MAAICGETRKGAPNSTGLAIPLHLRPQVKGQHRIIRADPEGQQDEEHRTVLHRLESRVEFR
jgi:hypothetical protein